MFDFALQKFFFLIFKKLFRTQTSTTMAQIQNYLTYPNVARTISDIENPKQALVYDKKNKTYKPAYTHYEHHVGSFASTIIKHVFSENCWIITPEKRDNDSGKKPDFTIQRVEGNDLLFHCYYEVKKAGGARLEEAMEQTVESIVETMDRQGQIGSFDTFVIVQRGLDIAFFEYHNDRNNLDEEGIQHVRGCVSLTQAYELEGEMKEILRPGPGVKKLSEIGKPRASSPIRREAKRYETPCVFNLLEHQEEINDLFRWIAENPPRSSC